MSTVLQNRYDLRQTGMIAINCSVYNQRFYLSKLYSCQSCAIDTNVYIPSFIIQLLRCHSYVCRHIK